MAKQPTIDDLLAALTNPVKPEPKKGTILENTKDTWKRIGEKDGFPELGLEKSELETFLEGWVKNNSYNNL